MAKRLSASTARTQGRHSGWLFRVSSSPHAGGGHIARSSALGLQLLRHGRVTMMLDPDGLAWKPRLQHMGFDVCTADRPASGAWFGCLLDGYHFDQDCFAEFRRMAAPLVCILDQGPKPADVDMIISPTAAIGAFADGGADVGADDLLGFEYALLDASFSDRPRPVTKSTVERVLVTCGLRDSANATGLIISALCLLFKRGFHPEIDIAIGSTAPHLADLERRLPSMDAVVEIHKDANKIADLISRVDMVIGAGGVSLFERMACGVPSITLSIAENQVPGTRMAHNLGATHGAGAVSQLTPDVLAEEIWKLAGDARARERQAKLARNAIDGRGAARVADAMMAFLSKFQRLPSMSGSMG